MRETCVKHVEAGPGAVVVLVCFDPSSSFVAVAAPDAGHAVGSCVVAVLGCLAAGLGLVGAAGRGRIAAGACLVGAAGCGGVTAGLGPVGSRLGVVGAAPAAVAVA